MKIMTTNTLPSQRQRQRQRVRTRNGIRYFGWRGIILIAIVVLINMLALHHYGIGKSSIEFTHLPPHNTNAMENESKMKNINANVNGKIDNHANDIPSNMTFIGISLSADTVTDSAIRFLVEAACVHGIKSYILLGEGSNKALTKKILAMIYHWHLPLPSIDGKDSDTTAADLKCINWIRVKTAPSQEVLKNTTRAHYLNSGSSSIKNKLRLKSGINNPLDPLSRIARIKRSREYQRQQLLENNTIRWGAHVWDWKYHDTVIGVLDLDLFGYPVNLTDVVEIAARYLIPGEENEESESDYSAGDDDDKVGKKFHAICANGLQVSEGRRSYYDIFSTILLPNTWLHRESDRFTARGTLEGEDVTLAKMTQTKTLQWFLKEGTTHKTNSSHSGGVNHDDDDDGSMKMNGRGNNQQQRYRVVPVRSCFNGFTLYRADIFFDSRCRYDMSDKSDDLYASKRERHTCEHIVFNECLRRTLAMDDVDHSFRIGVKPDLLTMWHLLQ